MTLARTAPETPPPRGGGAAGGGGGRGAGGGRAGGGGAAGGAGRRGGARRPPAGARGAGGAGPPNEGAAADTGRARHGGSGDSLNQRARRCDTESGGHAIDHGLQGCQIGVGHGPDGDGRAPRPAAPARELPGLRHLFGHGHPPPARNPDGVLLGGEQAAATMRRETDNESVAWPYRAAARRRSQQAEELAYGSDGMISIRGCQILE